MTAHKHLKQRIRARMEKTGERYATARRHVIRTIEPSESDSATRWHLPGNVPATTALRVMLAHAGVRAPHTGRPFSEAMLFGIAGGIGIGVFAFYYAREDHASFYIAGRHQWHDDLAYLRDALARFGMTAVVQETAGVQTAARQLHDTLEQHGPCIAWVDMAGLPHRAVPQAWSGGGYHVITVYSIDRADETALIGDLTDDPIRIPLADLAQARARIAKQRNRLLRAVPSQEQPNPEPHDLERLVSAGLERCHDGLLHPTLPGAAGNARLEALRTWAERIHGSAGKESWERTFRPGPNLWRGLCAIYDFIEHYGTGGGLCRPLFADFLAEAAAALERPRLAALAEQYAGLGRSWSELADAALPSDVPALGEAKSLYARKAELVHSGAAADELRAVWQRLGELEQQARTQFPLSDAACAELRAQLRARILALYDGEVAAHEAILQAIA
jgi:Domain of unknown function (DUF4872)/Butirosin biosynthesis protein H, N-terminal